MGGNAHARRRHRGVRCRVQRVQRSPVQFPPPVCREAPTSPRDLLEETWLRFVSSRATLHPDTRLAPWLFTIARNLFISYCRSRGREQSYTSDVLLWPDEKPPSPLQTAISNELQSGVEAALAALPTNYREALLLVGIERTRPNRSGRGLPDRARRFPAAPQAGARPDLDQTERERLA